MVDQDKAARSAGNGGAREAYREREKQRESERSRVSARKAERAREKLGLR